MNINIIDQKVVFLDSPSYWESARKLIGHCTRIAYRSENLGKTQEEQNDRDNKLFLRLIHPSETEHPQHTSTFEHRVFSVEIITDRAIANEIIRHRHTAYTQESTRYVNMGKRGADFIAPYGLNGAALDFVKRSYSESYENYLKMLEMGVLPQHARDVLPLGLATCLAMTTNITQWRNVFKLRCDSGAHPKVRSIMFTILDRFNTLLPSAFSDLYEKFKDSGIEKCKTEDNFIN